MPPLTRTGYICEEELIVRDILILQPENWLNDKVYFNVLHVQVKNLYLIFHLYTV